mgnify:CR=1 FL=1
MTHHFVNIITWKYFCDKKLNNASIYVDGFILKSVCLMFGLKAKKRSGLNFYHDVINDSSCFLLPRPLGGFTDFLVLPFWEEEKDIHIYKELRDFIKDKSSIVIGISGPKQDHLANLIEIEFPNKQIYCLGAAVTTSRLISKEWLIITWPTMLYNDPIRTLLKLKASVWEMVDLVVSEKTKQDFKLFIKKI